MSQFVRILFSLVLGSYSLSGFSMMQRHEFEQVNRIIFESYAPLVAEKLKAQLEIKELWYDFGGAFKVDSARKLMGESRYVVTLTGNIPQNLGMYMDGYAIVVCHEIGHILGGAPLQKRGISQWSSVEGQADYYATNDCMWRYIKHADTYDVIHDFDRRSINSCEEHFRYQPDKILGCLRIMSGIKAMESYLKVDINKKDASVVSSTLQNYPSKQCRIDTMVAGLLNQNRPTCWYKSLS